MDSKMTKDSPCKHLMNAINELDEVHGRSRRARREIREIVKRQREREETGCKYVHWSGKRYRSNSVTSPSVGETLRAAELIGDSGDADLDKGRRRAAIEVANASIRSDDLEE
nr:hypothetical protein L203_04734 [Cryptococcus depauperatus CBS 7841]